MARCATQPAARHSDGSADSSASSASSSSSADFLTEYVATRWYRAPEIMLSWSEYSQAIDVWSVGCIFGELLLRRPLFPGSDYMHQLHLILDFLGSPSAEDTQHIANDNARRYIRQLPEKKGQSIHRLFSRASPEACHLLQSMLTFSPHKRITVEQALAHPYLSQLHDPNDEPVADRPLTHELFDESQVMSRHDYKRLLWQEICHFHPTLAQHAQPAHHHHPHTQQQQQQQQRQWQQAEDADAMRVDS